jgi:hypothetical protein
MEEKSCVFNEISRSDFGFHRVLEKELLSNDDVTIYSII